MSEPEFRKTDRRTFVYAGLGAAVAVAGGVAVYLATRPPEVKIVEKPVEKTVVQTAVQTVEKPLEKTVEKTVVTTVAGTPTTIVQTQVQTVEKTQRVTVTEVVKIPIGGKLTMGVNNWSITLDPPRTLNVVAQWGSSSVCDRLTLMDVKGNILPNLAEKWESADAKDWIFTLRKGVIGHHGRELTAEDVAWNFERIAKLKAGLTIFPFVTGAEVIDKYTVKIKNDRRFVIIPISAALPTRANIAAKPTDEDLKRYGVTKEQFEKDGYKSFIIGFGPFKLVSQRADEFDQFVAHDQYWARDPEGRKLPFLSEMVWKVTPEPTVKLAALKTGEFDIIQSVPPREVPEISKDYSTFSFPLERIAIVMKTYEPPFNDVRMRQAVHLATNKKEILDLARQGVGVVPNSPLHPSDPTYVDVPGWGYNPEKAKQLMKEAGYEKGWKGKLPAYTTVGMADVAKIVKEQLGKVGFELEIEAMEIGAWLQRIYTGQQYNITVNSQGNRVETYQMLALFTHGKSAYSTSKYKNPEFDAIVDAYVEELDSAKRKELSKKAQERLMSESPEVYACYSNHVHAWNKRVKDVAFGGDGAPVAGFRTTWKER